MNAIQFIKLYGLNSARVTVEDAQENTHYCTETGYHSIKLDVAYEPCPDCVYLSELKRLVESVDRIDHFVEANDMGDDTHIENHISPLCKTESQPVLIVERDNQIIERLKAENVVLQAKVDELQVENKILNQAASTRLKNQMQFKKLYDALVEQLYPYALSLDEPVDSSVNAPKEFINGYDRARECAHYNLLEMMESDVEYIKAQCGMLGGEA